MRRRIFVTCVVVACASAGVFGAPSFNLAVSTDGCNIFFVNQGPTDVGWQLMQITDIRNKGVLFWFERAVYNTWANQGKISLDANGCIQNYSSDLPTTLNSDLNTLVTSAFNSYFNDIMPHIPASVFTHVANNPDNLGAVTSEVLALNLPAFTGYGYSPTPSNSGAAASTKKTGCGACTQQVIPGSHYCKPTECVNGCPDPGTSCAASSFANISANLYPALQ